MSNVIETKEIEKKIYKIRDVEVMLDSDLAEIYHCANGTKTINQAVKRNMERFPDDFYFKITKKEYEDISRSQFGTLKIEQGHNLKYLPYVFTEQGVAMLSTVIRTTTAAQTSINIMRAFVKMRHYINLNKNILPNKVLLLESKVDNNTKRIDELFDRFNPYDLIKDKILFAGSIYDSYSILLDILKKAKKEVIIIDNYAGKELLDILRNINIKIIIVSKETDNILKSKYLKEYSNVIFIQNNSFHDRFIIIDRKILYHSGASFKDLGKKCFEISEIESKENIEQILKIIMKDILT